MLQTIEASKQEQLAAIDWWTNLPQQQRELFSYSVGAREASIETDKILIIYRIKTR